MFLVLRCIDISKNSIEIEEFYLEFLKIDETIGPGLFENLQNALVAPKHDINYVRGKDIIIDLT